MAGGSRGWIQRWRLLGTGEEKLDLHEKSWQKHTQLGIVGATIRGFYITCVVV